MLQQPIPIHIPLRARDGSVRAEAIIDEQDADQALHRWYLSGDKYAMRTVQRPDRGWRTIYLHREILDLAPGDELEADHINGDRLDNRRCNLRVCTHAENVRYAAERRLKLAA